MTDWITERFCTLDWVFRNTLYEQIRGDVKRFNDPEHKCQFVCTLLEIDEFDEPRFEARCTNRDHRREEVIFLLHKDDHIEIRRPYAEFFKVVPQWSEDTGECELLIDGEVKSLDNISCRALSDLFFGRPGV